MADLAFLKGFQFFDDSGNPLNGGLLRTYDAGTTNARTVYQDDAEIVPWSQPITLNSAGRLTASVYVPSGDWKFTLTNSLGSTIATEDNIPGATAAADATFARPETPVVTKGASYTIVSGDIGSLFVADATGGAFTLTLPAAGDVANGQGIEIQQVGTGGAVTVAPNGSDTINGASSFVLRPQYGWVRLISDGADWVALPSRTPATLPAAKTGAYTVTAADDGRVILANATSAGFTVTLLPATTAGNGFRVGIKKTDSSANVVTIDGNASETIDGAATLSLSLQYDIAWIVCDGSNWHLVSYVSSSLRTIAGLARTDGGIIVGDGTNWVLETGATARASLAAAPISGLRGLNAQTGTSYTLVLTDAGKLVTMDNAAANTLTIPTNATVAFVAGETAIAIRQKGAGATTIQADTGVTLNGVSAGDCTIGGQFGGVTIVKEGADAWSVVGNHTVVS